MRSRGAVRVRSRAAGLDSAGTSRLERHRAEEDEERDQDDEKERAASSAARLGHLDASVGPRHPVPVDEAGAHQDDEQRRRADREPAGQRRRDEHVV
eukprot:7382819-Prymnesium_polylepis.1